MYANHKHKAFYSCTTCSQPPATSRMMRHFCCNVLINSSSHWKRWKCQSHYCWCHSEARRIWRLLVYIKHIKQTFRWLKIKSWLWKTDVYDRIPFRVCKEGNVNMHHCRGTQKYQYVMFINVKKEMFSSLLFISQKYFPKCSEKQIDWFINMLSRSREAM